MIKFVIFLLVNVFFLQFAIRTSKASRPRLFFSRFLFRKKKVGEGGWALFVHYPHSLAFGRLEPELLVFEVILLANEFIYFLYDNFDE